MAPCALFTPHDSPAQWLEQFNSQFAHLMVQDWQQISHPEQVQFGIVWKPTAAFFERFPNLTTVFNLGAGVDAILDNPAVPKHIAIYRIEDGGMAAQMQQYFSYFILHFFRNMDLYQQQQTAQQWQVQPFKAAANFRVGILGLGQLGSQVAQHLQTYGFDVAGWSRNEKRLPGVTSYAGPQNLKAFLKRTDALCCLLPLTPATQGILNYQTMSQLAKGAVVINAGRGEHLVVPDLLNLLDQGHLSGAVLDVFEDEPLAKADPLWQHPKIIITPHSSAQSEQAPCVKSIGHTIQDITLGRSPSGLVDRIRGY